MKYFKTAQELYTSKEFRGLRCSLMIDRTAADKYEQWQDLITFSATVGAVYAVSFGGRDSVPTSAPTISGATNLGYTYGWVDGRGSLGSLLICQATSTSVTITISKREVCAVVTRVTT